MKRFVSVFIFIIGFSVAAVSQSAGLDSTFHRYFPGINVYDSVPGILLSLLKDTSRFEMKDTSGSTSYFLYRSYDLAEANEAGLFLDKGDTTQPYPSNPYFFVSVDFGSKEECEKYFNQVRADFSKYLVMKKVKPPKRPMLGNSVDYDFYDNTNKRVMSVTMDWPFDMKSYYSVFISVYK